MKIAESIVEDFVAKLFECFGNDYVQAPYGDSKPTTLMSGVVREAV